MSMPKVKLYLYDLGPADPIQLYPEEVNEIHKLIDLNNLDIDPDDETYVHCGLIMNTRLDKHSWTTYLRTMQTEYQVKIPSIDGNKVFLPISLFKDKKEGDIVELKFPCIIRCISPLANTGIITLPQEGYVTLTCKLEQAASVQFNDLGPFEEALKKIQ